MENALTPEFCGSCIQMADALGLFDLGAFSFDTPPADYSDLTPGLLLDFSDGSNTTSHSVEVTPTPNYCICVVSRVHF